MKDESGHKGNNLHDRKSSKMSLESMNEKLVKFGKGFL